MKEIMRVERKQEVLSLVTDISYCHTPSWYGATFTDLKMDLILPKIRAGHKPCPAILWLCGGAYMVVDKSIWLPEMMRFARNGYVVASAQYRTSNGATFPEPLMDVKAAIRFLKAHAEEFCIDPAHIFVMGESAGGALASLAGTTSKRKELDVGDYLDQDSSVCGVVSFYGPAVMQEAKALQKAVGDGDTVVPDWTMSAYLGTGFTLEQYAASCAATYLDDGGIPPFMLVQGAEDKVVTLSMSDRFYEALTAHGVETEYLIVEGAQHGDDLLYQDEVIGKIMEFLARHI